MAYFAHHSGMLQSSLAEAGLVPYLVFQWLLERCDEDGVVRDVRPRLIAKDLSVLSDSLFSVEAVEAALQTLQQPDPSSKRKDHAGKRIIPHPDLGASFIVVSYMYYNEEWAVERRRKKAAKRQRTFRARRTGEDEPNVTQESRPVTTCHADVTPSGSKLRSETDAETQANAPSSSSQADDDDAAVVIQALNIVAPQLSPFDVPTVRRLVNESRVPPCSIAAVLFERPQYFSEARWLAYFEKAIREERWSERSPEADRGLVELRLRTGGQRPSVSETRRDETKRPIDETR